MLHEAVMHVGMLKLTFYCADKFAMTMINLNELNSSYEVKNTHSMPYLSYIMDLYMCVYLYIYPNRDRKMSEEFEILVTLLTFN